MKASVIRKAHFNAAHRLYNKNWSFEKNQQVYGKCNNPNYHGHNYELEVKVTGEIDPETGYVIDLGELKQLIGEQVTNHFDHQNLNEDVDDFQERIPTAENIAVVIYNRLRSQLQEEYKLQITLYETPRNIVQYPPGEV